MEILEFLKDMQIDNWNRLGITFKTDKSKYYSLIYTNQQKEISMLII